MAIVGGKDTEEGDRNRRELGDLENDLWIKDMPIKEGIETHFKYTNDIIAYANNKYYTNVSCQAAGNEVRKRLSFKKGKYEASKVLIRRLDGNEKERKLSVNIRWKV